MAKKKRQNHMKQADILFSKIIRRRDGVCVRCGRTENLQCAHIISRSYRSIRCDVDNAVALCRGCHVFFTHRPLEWQEWVEAMWPGRWGVLRERALAYERLDWKRRVAELKRVWEEEA